MTKRDGLEVAADVRALGNGQAGSHQDGRYQARLNGLGVDFVLDQGGEHARSLGVADQDDAPTVVFMGEIVVPGVAHIVVAGLRPRRRARQRMALHHRHQGGEGELPVHRREQPATGSKASELLLHDAPFGRLDGHGRDDARISRHGGIDVEAIDRRPPVSLERFKAQRAVRVHHRGGKINIASVADAARPA